MLRGSIASLLVFAVASAHAKDGTALSSSELGQIKKICHQVIGVPFQDASLAWRFAPFVPNHSEILQPETVCDGHHCSWSAHLRDGTLLVFIFLHVDPHFKTSNAAPDVTPDAIRKGNNRYVGVALIRKGKVIFSEGHIDSKTSNQPLQPTAGRRED
jgi:hypothetical protein